MPLHSPCPREQILVAMAKWTSFKHHIASQIYRSTIQRLSLEHQIFLLTQLALKRVLAGLIQQTWYGHKKATEGHWCPGNLKPLHWCNINSPCICVDGNIICDQTFPYSFLIARVVYTGICIQQWCRPSRWVKSQTLFICSHCWMQSEWYWCLQGRVNIKSPASYSCRQTAHL